MTEVATYPVYLLLWRRADRSFRRPTQLQTAVQRVVADYTPGILAPVDHRFDFAPGPEKAVRPGVPHLSLASGPDAVAGFVVAVVVDPLDAQALLVSGPQRPGPKRGEVPPGGTDPDASRPIPGVPVIGRVATPLHHVPPDLMQPGARFPVCAEALGSALGGETAAGARVAPEQVSSDYLPARAAVAATQPPGMVKFAVRVPVFHEVRYANHHPSAEAVTHFDGDGFVACHGFPPIS